MASPPPRWMVNLNRALLRLRPDVSPPQRYPVFRVVSA